MIGALKVRDTDQVIIAAGLILGILFGAFSAKKRGGKTLDILQYATVYAIAFTLLGLFASIIIERNL